VRSNPARSLRVWPLILFVFYLFSRLIPYLKGILVILPLPELITCWKMRRPVSGWEMVNKRLYACWHAYWSKATQETCACLQVLNSLYSLRLVQVGHNGEFLIRPSGLVLAQWKPCVALLSATFNGIFCLNGDILVPGCSWFHRDMRIRTQQSHWILSHLTVMSSVPQASRVS
jgi:hypothetical protein